ncbi:ABC transporter permease [Lactiplantibacillus plantarum]|uniref:ABC transporter permease n=1 Tax=Lactiplantibacillus plantarum TaxID=1590 RepID=UPI0021A64D18|nr:ABC transporter permease [Lactiplantibacillus plantarum]MCT3214136.1 ABC transporter permease [Lactiplantibacillus plantarum]MCT3271724.1 ABC transporter permease [Lactiplantibacillus plantarum]
MITLYRQELLKLFKKRSTMAIITIIVLAEIGFAILGKIWHHYLPAPSLFASNFTTIQWITLFLIAASASIISMESQYGTIKNLFTRKYTRTTVLISKWLTILTYSLLLYFITAIVSLILKISLYSNQIDLAHTYSSIDRTRSLGQFWLLGMGTNLLTLFFLLSLVFLLAIIFKNTTVAITCGLIGYFALGILSNLMFMLIDKYTWLKWNPLNFMNLEAQISNPKTMGALTKLTDLELLWGTIGYTVVFLLIGLYVYRQKEV